MRRGEEQAEDLCRRGRRLFEARKPAENTWEQIADNFAPDLHGFTTTPFRGENYGAGLFTAGPAAASTRLSNALPGLTRPDIGWFSIKSVGMERLPAGKRTEAERFWKVFTGLTAELLTENAAMFSKAARLMDRFFVNFGEYCVTVEERPTPNDPGLLIRCWHLRDVVHAEDWRGALTSHWHKFELAARKVCQMFSADTDVVHPEVREMAYDSHRMDEPVKVMRVVLPAKDYELMRGRKTDAEFVSVWIDERNSTIMRDKPMAWDPYVVGRMAVAPGFEHGYSLPAHLALPAALRVQEVTLSVLDQEERRAVPPLRAIQDAVIGGDIDIEPGSVTWIDGNRIGDTRSLDNVMSPMNIAGDGRVGVDMQERLLDEIRGLFFNYNLQMPGRGKTATETEALLEEFIRVNKPLVDLVEAEINRPILGRVIEAGMALGAYDPLWERAPDSILGREIDYVFHNPVREAQARLVTERFGMYTDIVARAAGVDPEVVQRADLGRGVKDVAHAMGYPEWVRDDETVARAKEAMQERALSQEAMNQAQQLAETDRALAQGQTGAARAAQIAAQAGMPPEGAAEPALSRALKQVAGAQQEGGL